MRNAGREEARRRQELFTTEYAECGVVEKGGKGPVVNG